MSSITIGVGVIGLGFMGRTHVAAYQSAAAAGFPCRLAAVADRDRSRRTGEVLAPGGNIERSLNAERLFNAGDVRGYEQPEELLSDPAVSIVSICTYTETHVDLAITALAAGKHVLVEKPVALRSSDVKRLADAARSAGTLCMPAMCMRFWPGWDWLRERVIDKTYGAVRSATFQRLGTGPTWASFYQDEARSGGAIFDLHIHDADFVYWCFGKPEAIRSAGDSRHVTTLYDYPHGPRHVVAEGAWDLAPAAGFRMRFVVNFEHATAEFDLAGSPALVVHTREKSEAIELPAITGYDGQIRHLVRTVAEAKSALRATVDEAMEVTRMLEAEKESQRTNAAVRLM